MTMSKPVEVLCSRTQHAEFHPRFARVPTDYAIRNLRNLSGDLFGSAACIGIQPKHHGNNRRGD